ncbi:hypothetical protein KIN20_025540 [Parelaphostrongylus tenuis]|uniref:Uncharacterized protein n=1 Tax=Parelaphostrongylus tenuis TaxID=148309 RepID=A0AAD5MVE1_PARTN|nr:hypothetical protein KIN20_025540 [Parelaphostrongylus tenuis]
MGKSLGQGCRNPLQTDSQELFPSGKVVPSILNLEIYLFGVIRKGLLWCLPRRHFETTLGCDFGDRIG